MTEPMPDVLFHEVALGLRDEGGPTKNSQLWTNEHVHHADLGRVHLRVVEAILSPATGSREIMRAVAFGFATQGLRVTQRDDAQGRITGQRIEAPYLASFSGRKPRSGMEKEEWRIVVATLGVSKNLAEWGGLERILLLEFMTDPCPKQNLAVRSVAAVSSFTEWASNGITRSDASNSGPSAVMIARQRSNQRADALLKGLTTELNRLHCPTYPGISSSIPASGLGTSDATGSKTKDEVTLDPFDARETFGVADLELLPWSRKAGSKEKNNDSAGLTSENNGVADGSDQRECGVEVPICLQFVEGLCTRALELSRREALETWRPLEQAVRQLERDNEYLRQLLEPKYATLGAEPPPVPTWSDRRGLGMSSWARKKYDSDAKSQDSSVKGSSAASVTSLVLGLIRLTPLFVVEESWVIAKVLPDEPGQSSNSERSRPLALPPLDSAHGAEDSLSPSGASPSSQADPGATQHGESGGGSGGNITPAASPPVVRAVVKALGDELLNLCERREEELLKESLPGAQTYVAKLEAYKSDIVSDKALRFRKPAAGAGDEDEITSEVDDDLWRLFGVVETRLYSSAAALGRKPGRIFVTFNTLWFHSKVMGFESRHVLPLVEVKNITVLGTALDISSSLLLTTRDGADIMLVFPGTRMGTLEPLALLLRQLSRVAAAEKVPPSRTES